MKKSKTKRGKGDPRHTKPLSSTTADHLKEKLSESSTPTLTKHERDDLLRMLNFYYPTLHSRQQEKKETIILWVCLGILAVLIPMIIWKILELLSQ